MNLENFDLRKLIVAGIGAVSLGADKAEELFAECLKRGEKTVAQGKELNEELKRKSKNIEQNVVSLCNDKLSHKIDVESMSDDDREALLNKLLAMKEKQD